MSHKTPSRNVSLATAMLTFGLTSAPLWARTPSFKAVPLHVASLAPDDDRKAPDNKEEEPKGDPVDVDKLPKVVVEAVKKDLPGARITKAAVLKDGNYFLDDVKVGKKLWDVTVTPKGKILKKVEMKDND